MPPATNSVVNGRIGTMKLDEDQDHL